MCVATMPKTGSICAATGSSAGSTIATAFDRNAEVSGAPA
jgi:hypothetical protein